VVVPVNGATMSAASLQSELNAIYAQANVSWTVSTAAPFSFNPGSDGLEAADATLFSKYSPEMRALRDSFRTQDTAYDKNAYYLFIVPNFSDPAQFGYMVRGRAVGFLSTGANAREAAHELGHGAFGLEHTFPDPAQGATTNLMDYPKPGQTVTTHLTKPQWETIHSNMPVFNWLDEEEDGSFGGNSYVLAPDFSVYNIPNSNSVFDDKTTRTITGTLPGFVVKEIDSDVYYSWKNGRYVNTIDTNDVYPENVLLHPDNRKVILFYNLEKPCGASHYIGLKFSSLQNILNR